MRRRSAWAFAAALTLAVWAAPVGAEAPAAPGSGPGDAVVHDPVGQADAGHADADRVSAGHPSGCDPAVAEALARSAEAGVEADLAIIRHPDQGIRNPDSILDFSCIRDLFDYRAFDVLFDPAGALDDILDLARRRICAAARDAYRRYLGRALDASVYTVPARRLPGLDPGWGTRVPERGNVIGDLGAGGTGNELFRNAVGGGP